MNYIDLKLGDFLKNIVIMSNVSVYDTYDDTLLFHARIGGNGLTPEDIKYDALEEDPEYLSVLNEYDIVYISSTDNGIEIGVVEE